MGNGAIMADTERPPLVFKMAEIEFPKKVYVSLQIMCNTRRITVNRVKECGRDTQQLYLYILKVQTELKVIFRMMNKLQ